MNLNRYDFYYSKLDQSDFSNHVLFTSVIKQKHKMTHSNGRPLIRIVNQPFQEMGYYWAMSIMPTSIWRMVPGIALSMNSAPPFPPPAT